MTRLHSQRPPDSRRKPSRRKRASSIVNPSATPFLIATNPRFLPDAVIGSEHLLRQLGFDAEGAHRRLGDAAYEQRLVLEQLLQLTGRRSLDGSDALAQYRSLMDNAAQAADALGLVLGQALTSVQIGALDQDIVWLVEQEVDGQRVLVPVVSFPAPLPRGCRRRARCWPAMT